MALSTDLKTNLKRTMSGGLFRPSQITFSKWYEAGNARVQLREFPAASECHRAVILEGFPSVSLTSLLAAGYVVDVLDLPLVGIVSSPQFPPRSVISKGVPAHPVRIFGDSRITVMQCEFKIESSELITALCDAMFDFAIRHQSKLLLTVEGDPSRGRKDDDDLEKLNFVSTSAEFSDKMTCIGHLPIENGVISGVTGVVLCEGPLRGVEVGCLLAPSDPKYPEANSAVKVIKALGSYLVSVDIPTEELEKKASALQESVSSLLELEKKQQGKATLPPGNMYL